MQVQFTKDENAYAYELLEHQLESEEWRTGLQLLDPLEDTWFKIDENPKEKFRLEGHTFFNLLIQISPDRHMYKRSIYTFLDWLGDIGGLH